MAIRFNAPPNWPAPPPGWVPPPEWQPDASWGPPPTGWLLWVDDRFASEPLRDPMSQPSPVPVAPLLAVIHREASADAHVSFFGARGKARELAGEADRLRAECDRLTAELNRLGALSVAELERRRDALTAETTEQTTTLERQRQEHASELMKQTLAATERTRQQIAQAETEKLNLDHKLSELRKEVVITEETILLQEAGLYEYQHPLSDAVAYQIELARLQSQIKNTIKENGRSMETAVGWAVNGSATQGRTMIKDYSKLMLRAYNAEADNLVRALKPYKLQASVERLTKVATTIARLGKTMGIRISPIYHQLRVKELELTADYREKQAEEKEQERAERARLREERVFQQEIERERVRLQKERQHYANALAVLLENGDEGGAERLREQLSEVDRAIEDVDYRAANIKAGYVYVISNVGAFGEKMVKVGMTRRLDPLDRVRELSDASVPFNFDVHALFFSHDAVGIELEMHARLADRRVNLVNRRREFFYVTPHEARQHLLELAGDLLQFDEIPEALEYRQSLTHAHERS